MTNAFKWLLSGLVALCLLTAVKTARADDCLELGWKDNAGKWVYYKAWVDQYDERGKVHIKYDYRHGELALRVKEHEDADGDDVIIFKGKWFEPDDSERWGHVFMKMEKGHHRAKGWYSYKDDDANKYDLALRDCKH